MPECAACGKQATADKKLLVCGRCRAAHYCSPECQKASWKEHKLSCKPCKPPDNRPPDSEPPDSELGMTGVTDATTVIKTDHALITRSRDSSGVHTQFKGGPEIGELVEGMACWCCEVGTAVEVECVVVAFAPWQLQAKQIKHEVDPANLDGQVLLEEKAELRSEILDVFGVQLRLTASEGMGNLCLGLIEETQGSMHGPAAPLTATRGTTIRSSFWFLDGDEGTRLRLPPNARSALAPQSNSLMKTFCNCGESQRATFSCIEAVPRVPSAALQSEPYWQPRGIEEPGHPNPEPAPEPNPEPAPEPDTEPNPESDRESPDPQAPMPSPSPSSSSDAARPPAMPSSRRRACPPRCTTRTWPRCPTTRCRCSATRWRGRASARSPS
jgi:hypothetical protein